MKNILIIPLLFICTIASATDYYVSSSGNDSNTGLSVSTPWKTITKVNSIFSTLKPGDRVLFNRGDTFYGTIVITKSGAAGSPITIGAYGSGANPVITGFTTATGWVSESGGIFSTTVSSLSKPNLLTINGALFAMGRYPNAGINLTIDSHATNVSITDADLNASSINWTGAEAVIRKNEYLNDRCLITNQVSSTLTYTDLNSSEDATDGYYYFLQNKLQTLDKFGEWYYDGTRLYIYFGTATPSNYDVKLSTLDNLVSVSRYNYTTVNGLSFKGANMNAISLKDADHPTVQNCTIEFAGGNGIYLTATYALIDNNFIARTASSAIISVLANTTITNNTIVGIGLIEGIPNSEANSTGIDVFGTTNTIQYNKIDSVGAGGIRLFAVSGEIRNNLVSNFSMNINDAGGIYATGGISYVNLIIDGNIILNGIGKLGKSTYDLIVHGIYLDSYSKNISVTNNTIAHCGTMGIMLSNTSNITLRNNTCYDNVASIYFLEWSSENSFTNITMEDNILVAKSINQITLKVQCNLGTLGAFGTADRNYYARPIDDNTTIYTFEGQLDNNLWKTRTLANWQAYSGQDANSHKSSIAITNINDLRFEYNASQVSKVITLSQPMIDIKGVKYSNSITLPPYTSSVLMVDPNPSQAVIPVYVGSVVENSTPSLLQITYNVNLANFTPGVSAFTVMVNGVKRNINSVVISGNKVQLTLASAIVFGDKITLSYTKPATNWLRSVSSGEASSFALLTVTNNLLNIVTTRPDSSILYDERIVIYPNPVHDVINISIKDPTIAPKSIQIINLVGKIVFHNTLNPDIRDLQIPVSLIQGLYILKLSSGVRTLFTSKIVVRY